MRKKKQVIPKNYLEQIPTHDLQWSVDKDEKVVLHIENKGAFNRIAQKLFKKPPVSYIHLDEMGSFIWPLIDGEKDLIAIGELVEEHFGEKAHTLYERIAKYFQILHSSDFVKWKEPENKQTKE